MDKLQTKMIILNDISNVVNKKELETMLLALNRLKLNELNILAIAINKIKNGSKKQWIK